MGRTADDYEVDASVGQVLRFPGLDLSKPGARWTGGENEPVYEQGADGRGGYRVVSGAISANTVPLLPNRDYKLSLLLECDYERPAEVEARIYTVNADGMVVWEQMFGLPNKTDGWQRWEKEFVTDPQAAHGFFWVRLYGVPPDGVVRIADVAVLELPVKEVKRYSTGEGATFLGSAGYLPMRVEDVKAAGDTIQVRTTGALYTFDLQNNTILARQLLERERDVSVWRPSLALKGLKVLSRTDKECVLVNDSFTIGIQCDSLVIVVPHEEVELSCESKIAGIWNRFIEGHLTALDDYGGMAVNPDIPLGSGRIARSLAGGMWELAREPLGVMDFRGVLGNTTFLSHVKPGWQIKWLVSPGERLAISIFPPRPYPWRESFESTFTLTHRSTPLEAYSKLAQYANVVLLWNFTERRWGMGWRREYVAYDPDEFRRHVEAAKRAGMKPISYMSPWFYYSRDPVEFTDQVRKLRDEYGLEGVYYDGLRLEGWVISYELMRLTREIFPNGTILVHHTDPPPLMDPALVLPAVATYADITYTGEEVIGHGKEWPYPKYVCSQYRLSNCVGVMKHDGWTGLETIEKELLMLRYNGRACMSPVDYEGPTHEARMSPLREKYFPVLKELQKLWEDQGSDPEFYEKHYLPRFEELTKGWLPE